MIDNNINKNLAKAFSNEALTASEHKEILEWKKEHEAEYKNLEQLSSASENTRENLVFNVDAAWQKLIRRRNKIRVVHIKSNYWKWIAAAASVLLVAGVYLFFSERETGHNTQLVKTDGTGTKTIALQDGSTVILNKNASLAYDDMTAGRIVSLTGEAYFDVARNDSKPFVIKTPNALVKVLGTAFNIKTTRGATTVNVQRGSVELSANSQRAILVAGEKGIFENNQLLKVQSEDQNYLAWKTRKLVFKETRLTQVVDALQDYYGVKININDSKAINCKVTTTFSTENITEALDELKLLLHFRYKQSGDIITIYNTDCN